MSFDYINEAFKRLDLLDEKLFNGSTDGINTLSQFLTDDDEVESVRVIDTEAQSSEDLQDSYVGKVIINCNICHSHIFENKEDIVIDDEGIVNSEESCPYCNEAEGFVIVGEIAPYGGAEDKENSAEETEEVTETEVVKEGLFNKGPSHAIIIKQKHIDEKGVEFDWIVAAVSNNVTALEEGAADLCTNTTQVDGSPTQAKVVDIKTAKKLTGEKRFSSSDWLIEDDEKEELTEDFKEVSIKTDDQHLEMTSDENGKVTIVTEPVEEQSSEEVVDESEVIAPVSDETTEEIIENNSDTVEQEEEPVAEEATEEPKEEDELETDVNIEDIDDEGMNELGESYFKNVYENVESFKTTDVSANSNTLIVEGLLTFTSGNQKKTGFVFESADVNSRGQLRFVGSNKHICEDTKAFSLIGRMDNNKLMLESLKYNYNVGEQTIRGRVTKK